MEKLTQAFPILTIGIAIGLLALAAWRDIALRLIPDWISITLAVLGVATRLASGWLDLLFSIVMGILIFFLLLMAFSHGFLGGGDVKLASALVLWLSPPACYEFFVMTALAGGVLAGVHLILRWLAPAQAAPVGMASIAARVWRVEMRRIRAGGPLPYGVAIMVGGGYALLGTLGG